jgi:hypothetical protein
VPLAPGIGKNLQYRVAIRLDPAFERHSSRRDRSCAQTRRPGTSPRHRPTGRSASVAHLHRSDSGVSAGLSGRPGPRRCRVGCIFRIALDPFDQQVEHAAERGILFNEALLERCYLRWSAASCSGSIGGCSSERVLRRTASGSRFRLFGSGDVKMTTGVPSPWALRRARARRPRQARRRAAAIRVGLHWRAPEPRRESR